MALSVASATADEAAWLPGASEPQTEKHTGPRSSRLTLPLRAALGQRGKEGGRGRGLCVSENPYGGGGARGDVPCPAPRPRLESPGPGGGAECDCAAISRSRVPGRAPALGWSWKERVLRVMRFYF